MHAKRLAIGLGALAVLTLVAGSARADDDLRLSLPGSTKTAPTLNLKATPADLTADTVATYHRGGFGGYRGGYRGFGYGGYRGFGYGGYRGYGYGGYRGFGYGGYRGFGYGGYRGYGYGYRGFGVGLGLGLGYGLAYRGLGYGLGGYYGPYYSSPYYYPSSYYLPSYSYPLYSSCYSSYYSPITYASPIIGSTLSTEPGTIVGQPSSSYYGQPAPALMPPASDTPALPAQPGTYPYDGGPSQQVPMPPPEESAVKHPPRMTRPAVVNEVLVGLPERSSGKWNYPAYGDVPTRQGATLRPASR